MDRRIAFIAKRFLSLIFTIFGITVMVFIIRSVIPSDPIYAILGPEADVIPAADLMAIKKALGLDKPLYIQYFNYLWNLIHGDLGTSLTTQQPVARELLTRIPATAELATAALIIMLAIGIPLGVYSALKKGTIADDIARVFSLGGLSIPSFFLSMLLLLAFYVHFGLIEPGRLGQAFQPPPHITGFYTIDSLLAGRFATFFDSLRHIIAPAFVLGYAGSALISRLTRASMLDVLDQDYIRTARSKGLAERTVIYNHALRNALIPTITQAGISLGSLLSGAVVVESVFSWPGVGLFAAQSALALDFPSVMGVAILIAIIFVTVNFLVDISYGLLDPRISV